MAIKIVYSDAYEVNIGNHVFPTAKFRLVRERLINRRIVDESVFVAAPYASRNELLLVHSEEYLNKLDEGTLSPEEIYTLELPYSKVLGEASRVCVGGTILAAKLALQERISVHLGGGFHHAFADHGEGFCVLNDVACAAQFCQLKQKIERIMIVDCDLHQGNGSADIFKNNKNVFTFSIHQENNYPVIKPPSDLDIGLADGTGDEEYLDVLQYNLTSVFRDFRPQLIFYIAGADPYFKDQLGGLRLTIEGLSRRDKFVFTLAKQSRSSVAVIFGGGYALDIDDTVTIHYNTVREALEAFT
jgi:acetoin utilization deacetylase AcuC-like enzyme